MFIEPPEAPDIGPQSTDGEIVEFAQDNLTGIHASLQSAFPCGR